MVGVLAVVFIGVSVVVLTPKPVAMSSPEGSWSFDAHCAWLNPCSHYNVTYDFPFSTDTGSKGSYNITFKVLDLAWTTTGVDLHRMNVTFQIPSGVEVYNKSFIVNTHLSAGQKAGPLSANFSFTDPELGLSPTQNLTLSGSITAEFDEISVFLGNHYSKSERTSNIGIPIHSSTVPPLQSATQGSGFSWASVMPFILLGSFLWILTAMARMLFGLPRPTSFGSGFKDPGSGRFVSSKAALIAYATVAMTVFLWVMSTLGTPDNIISYGELVFGGLTGNFPLSAGLSVANYSLGTLLHLRR
jgi:hypothetical protein